MIDDYNLTANSKQISMHIQLSTYPDFLIRKNLIIRL